MARLVATALKFGFPLEALLQIVRVASDSLGRVSEAMVRLFHVHVHEQLRAQGLSGPELMAATQNLADPMSDLVEPTVMYLHRKAWERANREDMILHLLEEAWGDLALTGPEFDWWFRDNPAGSLMSVARSQGRVVGVASHSLFRMVLGGESRVASFSVHATTEESARGQGIFEALE